jgi:Type II secretory pathway, prepilin signal peptidase PulO and related peptidases
VSGVELIGAGVLVLLLTPIVASDLAARRIPNGWNLALGLSGLGLQLVQQPAWRTLGHAVAAALAAAALLYGLIWTLKALKRPAGLGLGDVKFLIAASQWVGFVGVAWVFVAASLLAIVAALVVAPWRGLDLKRQMPFAPALAAALLGAYGAPLLFG